MTKKASKDETPGVGYWNNAYGKYDDNLLISNKCDKFQLIELGFDYQFPPDDVEDDVKEDDRKKQGLQILETRICLVLFKRIVGKLSKRTGDDKVDYNENDEVCGISALEPQGKRFWITSVIPGDEINKEKGDGVKMEVDYT